jgi:ferritin
MKQKLLSSSVESKLNDFIKEELTAMYTYVALANWCQNAGFLKAYSFFIGESADEKGHSELLQKYILDMGCIPTLQDIDTPEIECETLSDAIYVAMEMEVNLGKKYADFASDITERDFMTLTKIQEFIKIQTESIGFYGDICAVANGISKDKFQQLELEEALVEYAG